jgi:hypothetical protein
MHDHRNAGPPRPAPGSPEYVAQRRVLGQLVVDPPPTGDRIDTLPAAVGLSMPAVTSAVAALIRAGLAEQDGEFVRASPAATYFEYLWPVML